MAVSFEQAPGGDEDVLQSVLGETILLVSVEDARYDAVAKILGIPTGTVGSRLYHGRNELRRLMGYEGPSAETIRQQALRTGVRTTRKAA